MTDRKLLATALDVAVEAAIDAGRIIRTAAGRLVPGSVRDKGTNDLVTQVDLESQKLIVGRIREAFPGHAVLAEEDEAFPGHAVPAEEDEAFPGHAVLAEEDPAGETGNAGDFRWIVDPLDGTTNFAHGVPPYAVSIALQVRGVLAAAVVYDVPHDELHTAIRGGGTRLNGRPVRVSRTATLDQCLVTTGFPYRPFEHVEAYLGVLRNLFRTTRGVRRPGSASVDLAWVACGRFDAFFEVGLAPWDVAAGTLLVLEAGGRVSDFGGGGDPLFGGRIAASNGPLHGSLLEAVAALDSFGT